MELVIRPGDRPVPLPLHSGSSLLGDDARTSKAGEPFLCFTPLLGTDAPGHFDHNSAVHGASVADLAAVDQWTAVDELRSPVLVLYAEQDFEPSIRSS